VLNGAKVKVCHDVVTVRKTVSCNTPALEEMPKPIVGTGSVLLTRCWQLRRYWMLGTTGIMNCRNLTETQSPVVVASIRATLGCVDVWPSDGTTP
jgi:hypothetical protein